MRYKNKKLSLQDNKSAKYTYAEKKIVNILIYIYISTSLYVLHFMREQESIRIIHLPNVVVTLIRPDCKSVASNFPSVDMSILASL